MSITSSLRFFNTSAQGHLETSANLLALQSSLAYFPHYSGEAHANALLYPLCFSLKTLISAARIAQGSLLLLAALLEKPEQNLPLAAAALSTECACLLMNALNAVAACLFFISRSLSSLNFGYPEQEADAAMQQSMMGQLFIGMYSKAEDYLYEKTTRLSH